MQEVSALVSVIIPAYNAERFIVETIDSVKKQTWQHWEIIVVNDGSTDSTVKIVTNELSADIRLVNQSNAGVSAARNNGLEQAKGEYVVFLDADDLMTPMFIETRINFLQQNPALGFTGGWIESFPVKSEMKKAAADDAEREILFFDASCATIPSNYMFRRKVLDEHTIRFNTKLSSTADRFFILQVSRFAKGKRMSGENGKLLYRVSEHSMSHHITPGLIFDNEKFYTELVRENMTPLSDEAKFKSIYFYSLGLGFAKIKHFQSFIKYFWQSFMSSPAYFMKQTLKQLTFTK
jgi:glycosyltransferase involved in cell wall biosynthesis